MRAMLSSPRWKRWEAARRQRRAVRTEDGLDRPGMLGGRVETTWSLSGDSRSAPVQVGMHMRVSSLSIQDPKRASSGCGAGISPPKVRPFPFNPRHPAIPVRSPLEARSVLRSAGPRYSAHASPREIETMTDAGVAPARGLLAQLAATEQAYLATSPYRLVHENDMRAGRYLVRVQVV